MPTRESELEAQKWVEAMVDRAERRANFGYFLPEGYGGYGVVERPDLAPLHGKMMYEFTLNPHNPLTFHDPAGIYLQPDRHGFLSDQGSIPRLLQRYFPKDEFPRSYYMHDSCCLHHGAYFSHSGIPGSFDFYHLSRKQVDDLLRQMVRAEGGSWGRAYAIWMGVRAGAKTGLVTSW